jgi:hypothetical protein
MASQVFNDQLWFDRTLKTIKQANEETLQKLKKDIEKIGLDQKITLTDGKEYIVRTTLLGIINKRIENRLMDRIKPNIDFINSVNNMAELQKIKTSLQTQKKNIEIDNMIKANPDKDSIIVIGTLLKFVDEKEKLLSDPEYLEALARLQREELARKGEELQKMMEELNFSFGGRKTKKSIRKTKKSVRKSIRKKSVRKSKKAKKSVRKSKKAKKSGRKSKKINKSGRKSVRKAKKSVRKSTRKTKSVRKSVKKLIRRV